MATTNPLTSTVPGLPDKEQDDEKLPEYSHDQKLELMARTARAFHSLNNAQDTESYLNRYRENLASINHDTVEDRLWNMLILCLDVPERDVVKQMTFKKRWHTIMQVLERWKIACWFVYRGRCMSEILLDPEGALELNFARSVDYERNPGRIGLVDWPMYLEEAREENVDVTEEQGVNQGHDAEDKGELGLATPTSTVATTETPEEVVGDK